MSRSGSQAHSLWYAHIAREAKQESVDDMFRCVCVFAVILAAPTWAAEQMYSVVLSGTGTTTISSMATDPQGNAYIAGTTNAADFPVTPGAFQTRLSGAGSLCQLAAGGFPCYDAFVAKLDPTGKIVWATFLGGSVDENVNGIAFDSGGNVYVAGYTWSPDFPATTTLPPGAPACFVAKLSPGGASLVYSFVFRAGTIGGLAVDPHGNAYVAGLANPSSMTPTPNAFQTQPEGGYVGKLNQAGSGWDYLTFLGGTDQDTATGIAVNANGEAYVAGRTSSANFPGAVRGAQKTLIGSTDLFVAKLTASGSGLYWSTYLGTGGDGLPVANIALDASGGVYVATAGEFVPSVAFYKLTPDGSAFVYSKTLGIYSQHAQYAPRIVVNAAGEVYLGGTTDSQNLPVTPGALEGANYILDGYILKFDATGSKVLYGSFFSAGSVWTAGVQGIGLDAAGHLYAAGSGAPTLGNHWWACVVKTDLTQTPPVWLGAVLNSASYAASEIAPGELVTLFGAGIGPATPVAAQVIDGKLPAELSGVKVLVNGVAAPLLYVSSGQINAVVPFRVPVIAEFVVAVQGGQSNAVSILTTPSNMFGYPVGNTGVFTRDATGRGQAAALNQDGTLNSPSNPAPRGSIVAVWVTGAGPTDPPQTDGEITPVDSRAGSVLPLVAVIGASMVEQADVLYAGVAPGLVAGVDQVNFRIPEDAPTGPAVPLTIRPYRSLAPVQTVTIAVQ